MDYGWALVPAETTDFNFMKGWGVEKDTRHAEVALSLARQIRGITDQGFDPLHVLGFSYGGIIAYSLTGEETQRPHFSRNVKGIIVGDVAMKLKEKSLRDYYCNDIAQYQSMLDAGAYNDDTGVFLKQVSDLALSSPDDGSPIVPGFTNYQLALVFGANTGLLNGQFWHFVGGYLDANGIPSDLRFTEARLWLDLLQNIPPHCTVQADFDVDATFCGKPNVPFDDHLGEIAVPILFVGTGGGFGEEGYYTTTLTDSRDVTKFTVSVTGDRATDFGHADQFLSKDAQALVWQPILNWLKGHR
jgi:pimeloyl-ACP methyl ester carboxylesterase